MKYKLLRALCYLKELLAMLLCKLLGAVCRDNGYWFYRYLRPHLRGHLRSVTAEKDRIRKKSPAADWQRGTLLPI